MFNLHVIFFSGPALSSAGTTATRSTRSPARRSIARAAQRDAGGGCSRMQIGNDKNNGSQKNVYHRCMCMSKDQKERSI